MSNSREGVRPIDANALLKHAVEADRMGAMLVVGMGYILDAATVTPVKRGSWVPKYYDDLQGAYLTCSCCGQRGIVSGYPGEFKDLLSDYCPSCGAKMDEEVPDIND